MALSRDAAGIAEFFSQDLEDMAISSPSRAESTENIYSDMTANAPQNP